LDKIKLIGEQIKYLRKQAGLTQSQLAEGIITQAQISNIEKGNVLPLCTTLYELANKLGVNVNYFYEQAYNIRFDYMTEVKKQVRKAIRERDYLKVEIILKDEFDNPLFKVDQNRQFLLWHWALIEYYNKRNFSEAIRLLRESIDMDINPNIFNLKVQRIAILNSLAILYNEEKDYLESINIYNKAFKELNSLIELRNFQLEVRLCYGISKSLSKIEEIEQSNYYSKRGIEICINNESLYLLGELYYQLGQNYDVENQKDLAKFNYKKAEKIFELTHKEEYISVVKKKIMKLQLD